MLGVDVRRAAEEAGHEVAAPSRHDLDICDAPPSRTHWGNVAPRSSSTAPPTRMFDGAETEPDRAHEVNATAAGQLAAAAGAQGAWIPAGVQRLRVLGAKDTPYLESDSTGPPVGVRATPSWQASGRWPGGARRTHDRPARPGCSDRTGPASRTRCCGWPRSATSSRWSTDQVGLSPRSPDTWPGAGRPGRAPAATAGVVHGSSVGRVLVFGFAAEIVRAAGLSTPVRPISTAEFPGRLGRLRLQRAAQPPGADGPELPDWRAGLSEYLSARLVAG